MLAKRILLVDDDPAMRDLLLWSLEDDGHTVESVADASEALEKFEPGRFDLVVTDFRLPGMPGDQLADELKRRCPAQKIVLLTGLPPDVLPPSITLLLRKPFPISEFKQTVAALS